MMNGLINSFSTIFRKITNQYQLNEKNLETILGELEKALVDADVPYNVVVEFLKTTKENALKTNILKGVKAEEQFVKIVYDELTELLGGSFEQLDFSNNSQYISLFGMQGSGKTTTTIKLAHYFKGLGKKVLVCSVDKTRLQAKEQLRILAQQAQIDAVFFDKNKVLQEVDELLKYAKKNIYDIILLDTAGRMNIDNEALKEAQKIVEKLPQSAYNFLILDALNGQQSQLVIKEFGTAIPISGSVVTKFDSDTRGGVAFSVIQETKKPLFFIGIGEKIEDLESFKPEGIASRILGMGDVVSLVEKVEQTLDKTDQEQIEARFNKKDFSLEDYYQQLKVMAKMGKTSSLMKFIPGLSRFNLDEANADKSIILDRVILSSMTKKERMNFRILGPSRKKRIASGSGTNIMQINKLLKKFEKMRLMIVKMTKNKQYKQQMTEMLKGGF